MVATPEPDLETMSDRELAQRASAAIDQLSRRGTPDSFALLLELASHTGQRVGDAARTLARAGSWSEVAGVSGTSRQAAWERWRA